MTFETLMSIVVAVNALATIELWRRAARRPEKPKKKFLKRVFDSKPITPKHQPPLPLKEGYAVGIKELQFFGDFKEFADVVNWWLAGYTRGVLVATNRIVGRLTASQIASASAISFF
jgi:hypothetical protein